MNVKEALYTQFGVAGNRIKRVFDNAGIVTWEDLSNAPRTVGHIGELDIYQIVAQLMRVKDKPFSEGEQKS